MSKEAILQIREAEDKADVLCRVAEEKATELRERVKAQGEAHCAAVRENTEAEYAAVLADMHRRALDLEEKKRLEALSQAEALKTAARERIDEAIHIIVWEIVEKCQ